MATLFIDNIPYEVPDDSSIAVVCENAGIPFSCNTGVCGTCQIKVLEGHENLGKLKPEEIELGLSGATRLSCQCYIKSGTVKITY